jgi:GNAT superfamily N-acetyltransferase
MLVHGVPLGGRWQGHHGGAEPRAQAGPSTHGRRTRGARVRRRGWCQFGPPEELPRIKSRAAYEKDRTALPDWRIACCYVGKGYRRRGVATAALAGALDMIASLGGGTVEGYPEPAGSVPAGFLYNGALSTYERLGFTRIRQIGKHRWVVATRVEHRSS